MEFPVHGPSFETEGGGSGAGAGSQGAGAGSSSFAGAGAQGGGSQGSGSSITLSDDSLFTPPGATAPVKFGEWRKGFIPRTEHESTVKQTTTQLLTRLGQLAQQAQNAKKQAGQRGQQHQPPADPYADLRDMPLADGKALASLAERIQREGVAPLHQWAGQVNKAMQTMMKQVQALQQGVGSVTERHSTADFHGKLDRALASVPVADGITLGQLEPEMQSFLREFAQDVYLSYDPKDPTLEAEFPQLLKSRIEGFSRLFRALDAKKLEVAKQKRSTFLKTGGGASPSGNRPGKPPSHREMAQMLFRPNAAT